MTATKMPNNIIDMLHLIAPDDHTLARQVSEYLKNGWVLAGPSELKRPLNDLSTTVLMQWVVRPG